MWNNGNVSIFNKPFLHPNEHKLTTEHWQENFNNELNIRPMAVNNEFTIEMGNNPFIRHFYKKDLKGVYPQT